MTDWMRKIRGNSFKLHACNGGRFQPSTGVRIYLERLGIFLTNWFRAVLDGVPKYGLWTGNDWPWQGYDQMKGIGTAA